MGSIELEVSVISNTSTNILEINKELLGKLSIEKNTECNLKIENNTIHLGPVVGVFTSNGTIRKANQQEANFRIVELVNANMKAKTILYFFSIKDIDFITNKINGTYYNYKNHTWQKKLFPLPEILYDRGGGTLEKQVITSNYIRQQFNHIKGLKKINPYHYFDKLDVYNRLIKYSDMAPYLPLTKKYTTPSDLEVMFKYSNTLYFKDRFGSNGLGVMKICKLSNETYTFSYYNPIEQNIKVRNVASFEKLVEELDNYIYNDKYIIQTAIDVIKIKSRPVDLRATVQRDGSGNIVITGIPVRIGLVDSPITSTRSGSHVFIFKEFFELFTNYSVDGTEFLLRKVYDFLYTTYEAIEKAYGTFGEIGIDFAIDQNHRLWFIECNAKPGKDTLYFSSYKDVIEKAFLNPLEYSKFISDYN